MPPLSLEERKQRLKAAYPHHNFVELDEPDSVMRTQMDTLFSHPALSIPVLVRNSTIFNEIFATLLNLLFAGVTLESSDSSKTGVLASAVIAECCTEVIAALIAAGANVNAEANGTSLLTYAKQQKGSFIFIDEIIDLLTKAGAKEWSFVVKIINLLTKARAKEAVHVNSNALPMAASPSVLTVQQPSTPPATTGTWGDPHIVNGAIELAVFSPSGSAAATQNGSADTQSTKDAYAQNAAVRVDQFFNRHR